MAMTSSASERFLNAFATIEGVLRKRFNLDPGSRFYAMVDAASARDAAIRRYSLDLKEFADLRNAIVHERTDGHPIAEPHEASVQRLEAIQQRLSDPPKLGSMFATKVVRAGVDEPIGRPAGAMLRGSFSQVPVYDGELFAGLLTAETIARWVAAQLADGVDVDREARRIAHVTTKAISRDLERDRRLLHDIRREVAKQSDRLSRDIERAVPRIERRIEHDLALLDKDVLRHLPSAQAIAQWTGTISSFAALAGLVLPPPADVAAEAIAIGLAEVSITASTVDAIKHPNDPGRTVDALVQIGLVRLGVSGSTTDERRVRAAAALISQLYYDFLRKGH